MKLNYKLKVCLMAFAFIFIGSTVMATNNFKTEITSENSDEWELMKSESGINVYFLIYEDVPGTTLLKIKFENTLDQDLKMDWTLQKGDYKYRNMELILGSKKTLQIDKTSMIISFGHKDSLKDFIITFNKKK